MLTAKTANSCRTTSQARLAKFGVEVTSTQPYAILFSTQTPISNHSSSPAKVLQKGGSVSSLHSLSCHLMEGQCGTRVSEIWDVADCPMCNTEVPVHSARSPSRLLFCLFLIKHPGLTLHCPSLSLSPRLGVEKVPCRGRMGWLSLKD